MPRKTCIESECKKFSQGNTDKCKAHGGGLRCTESGCLKAARGNTERCAQHGGGVRCIESGCKKIAQGKKSNVCISHGGGLRGVLVVIPIFKRLGIEGLDKQYIYPSVILITIVGIYNYQFLFRC